MSARRASLAALCTALLLGLAWGCAAASSADGFVPGSGGNTGIAEAGFDSQVLSPDGGLSDDAGTLHLNPLCGNELSTCLPDSAQSCSRYTPPAAPEADASLGPDGPTPVPDSGQGGSSGRSAVPGGSTGSGAASSSSGDASGAGGAAGEGSAVSAAGAAGAAGASGTTGSSAAGTPSVDDSGGAAGMFAAAGSSGAPTALPPAYGCQVRRVEGAKTSVVAQCSVAGPGGANSPCFSASDCQSGFGCVGDQNAGLCQQYCCQSRDLCGKGTYCADRPLRDATVNALPKGGTQASRDALLIPVCVPAENCDLGTTYPCASGAQCACQSGTACMVVRSDGTTTCAVPGAGKVGDRCPCAWGHVCSASTNQCLKLCYTRDATSCGDGKCQASAELPDGWGVCVGSAAGG